ncbi:nucleotidyltransferase family protein [candidate division KSB1 bacterium]|nr:nucleotidyltransferase family protein [candidate division KSB1 bacterium]
MKSEALGNLLTSAAFNWEYIIETAWQHRLTPLLYQYLKKMNASPPDPALKQRLEKDYQNRKAHNIIILDALQKFLQVLAKFKIPVIIIKGPYLAEKIYKNVPLRPMNDIDLIIRDHDWLSVKSTLLSLGYKIPDVRDGEVIDYAHYSGQIRCYRPNILVEVHFRLLNMGLPKDESYIWQRAQKIVLCGAPAYTLSPEDTLVHLLVHMNVHRFSRMIWFADVYHFLKQTRDLDWDYIVRFAERRRMKPALYGAFQLTEKILKIDVPAFVFQKLRPGRLRVNFYNRIWHVKEIPHFRASRNPVRFEGPLFYLLEMDGVLEKIKYLTRILLARRFK